MASKSNRKVQAIKDLTGKVFDRLTVVGLACRDSGRISWFCRCVCGHRTVVRGCNLQSGNSRSCGCISKDSRKGIPHHEARERANPCTKRNDGYMLASTEWAKPFMVDECTSVEDVVLMSTLGDLSKGRIIAMMYKAGNPRLASMLTVEEIMG